MDDVIALFHRYKDPVYRLALSFTGSPADAEDVTQTVFLKYLETQPELEEGKERAWLLQVTANQCRDLWRRLRRRGGETSLQGTKLLYHRPLIRHGFAVPPSPQGEGFFGGPHPPPSGAPVPIPSVATRHHPYPFWPTAISP